jgi:hypothetical protein
MSPLLRDPAKANANASRRLILILALFLFIIALSLIIIQSIGGGPKLIRTYGDGYADGFKKARAMAIERMPNLANPMTLSGVVASVGSDGMTIEAKNLFIDEKADGIGTTRTIKVTSDTKIIESQQLSPEEMQKAQADFAASMKIYDPNSGTPAPIPPSAKQNPISLKDIVPGDRVVVVPVDGTEDVSLLKTISAKTVKVIANEVEEPTEAGQ